MKRGSQLGPYEILAPLGAGAMGEVYRARDPRLDREVAIKVLPEELASEPERLERFEREAKTLAALNHPHIVTIHSVEQAEDQRFLTMELVEGKTLAQVIPQGGLSLSRFFGIAIPLAEAVSAAHERGITHRDLKPGNVLVTDEGRVKVLDFGLAKLGEDALTRADEEPPTEALTEAGQVLGTMPYMSPEQVQGKAADPRSDVFSLGIMLYEMATGERPFKGETAADLISSILRDVPRPVMELKGDLPRDVARIIHRCLEKEPTRRLQSTLDLANELEELKREADSGAVPPCPGVTVTPKSGGQRRWFLAGGSVAAAMGFIGYLAMRPTAESPATSPERTMLVVLPFENLGPPEDAYFAAGMTEEVTSRLARVSGLGVISRTSAVQYDRAGKTLTQIGKDLGVGFVLEGTVRWDRQAEGPGRVRITPQLVRVADDTHLWADSYDRVLDDIFAVQSEIAVGVVDQLGIALLGAEQQALEARSTDSLEAYQAYLRGQAHFFDPDRSIQAYELAIRMFERAVEHDPSFVAALALLSEARSALFARGYDRSARGLEKAREAATRALELEPDSAEANRALGYYYFCHRDYERALEAFDTAARSLPNDSGILGAKATVHRRQGRFEEAVAELERATELDPRDARASRILGRTYRVLRRYPEAERYFELSISRAPGQDTAYRAKAELYLSWTGSLDRARVALERMPGGDAPSSLKAWFRVESYERNHQAVLDRLASAPFELARTPGHLVVKPLLIGRAYHFMNQPERARAPYEAAAVLLEEVVRETPEDDRAHRSLAEAYAGLGRKAEALSEAKRAVELLPVSSDAFAGPIPLWSLAFVETMVGEHETAIDHLEYLLSIPSWWSVWDLRLDPRWDPLRDHPRFRTLVADEHRSQASR